MKLQFPLITADGLCLNSKTQLEVIFSRFEKPNKTLAPLKNYSTTGNDLCALRSLDPHPQAQIKRRSSSA
jgi:hypothetical protein